jgi:SAM-dependent methyltransferase
MRAVASQAPFDLIVSGFAIHHQPDERKPELYQEIFGLRKPGGIFLHRELVVASGGEAPSDRHVGDLQQRREDDLRQRGRFERSSGPLQLQS